MQRRCLAIVTLALLLLSRQVSADSQTLTVPFVSHDGHAMVGKLVLPDTKGSHPVVIYVQNAEAMTVDMKRLGGPNGTFNYFDLYRTRLAEANIGFFSYEGRGVTTGDAPPRFERIDWPVYNTSTLDNKVRDVLSAVRAVQAQPGVNRDRILLIGASEGSLLAAEAASRIPSDIRAVAMYGVLSVNMRDNFSFVIGHGAFMVYRSSFDVDRDGRISRTEFETDARRFRRFLPGLAFPQWDRDGDGFFTVDENRLVAKTLFDALEGNDFAVLDGWAKKYAATATPEHWFKDHFAHPEMWTFLAALNLPVGLFHGSADTNTWIEDVRRLEQRARTAGKPNLVFQYFEGSDHSLNVGQYFTRGRLPAGHQAIFDFLITHAR